MIDKAIKYIYDHLNSVKSKLDENTNYHFYVFGFSRGATCARLFTELTTRDEGEKLPREKEFGQETSKVANIYEKHKKRIPFMESTFIDGLNIKRDNVTVEEIEVELLQAIKQIQEEENNESNLTEWCEKSR